MRFEAGSFKSLRFLLAAALILALAWFTYYCFWVQDKTRALTSRNFRLLNALGTQVHDALTSQSGVLGRRLINPETGRTTEMPELVKVVPILDRIETFYLPRLEGRPFESPIPVPYLARDVRAEWLRVLYYYDSSHPSYLAQLKLRPVLDGILGRESNREAFDAVLLATSGGEVVYQEGDPALRLARLDSLLAATDEKKGAAGAKSPAFEALARSTSAIEVTLSGARYKLFIQPCCGGILTRDPLLETAAAESNLLVAGLVSQQRLTASSFAFSYSLLALLSGLLLLGVFSWPFLKLSLIGTFQRVRVIDVWLVALCGSLALMLVTLFWFDFLAYQGLKRSLRTQLEAYSAGLRENSRREIRAAYGQLIDLEARLASERAGQRAAEPQPAYPFFEAYLIDGDGTQVIKRSFPWKPNQYTTPVKDRQYFSQVIEQRTWPLPPAEPAPRPEPECGRDYVIESIRSWTYGEERAAISKPTGPAGCPREAPGRNPIPVAALSIPMSSLIKPVAPPGFGFAVVDEQGIVLFHSDAKRNLLENFFAETDRRSLLEAAVLARSEKDLDLRYWGNDYLAHIAPFLPGTPWFIVTFYDKQLARTLNIEWLVTTLLLVAVYAGLYLALGAVVAINRPGYRAAWLWPDPRHAAQYRPLALLYALMLLVFAAVLYAAGGWALLAASIVIPLLAWIVTYRRLRGWGGRPPARKKVLLTFSYSVAATLLLLLTAALPPVAFFKFAHELQSEAFIRYGQLKLARALARQAEDHAATRLPGPEFTALLDHLGAGQRRGNSEFFFNTQVTEGGLPHWRQSPVSSSWHTTVAFFVPPGLTHLAPSEAMRELLREEASDQVWQSRREGRRLSLAWQRGGRPNMAAKSLLISSLVPGLGETVWAPSGAEIERWPLLPAIGTIGLLAVGLVWFFCRRVFLSDLAEPIQLYGDGRVRLESGKNFLLIGRTEQLQMIRVRNARRIDVRSLVGAGNGHGSHRDLGCPGAGSDRNRRIFIKDFEYRAENRDLNERVLGLLEELLYVRHRAVIITSPTDPTRLVASAPADRPVDDQSPGHEERWARLLGSFNLIEVEHWLAPDALPETRAGAAGREWHPAAGSRRLREEAGRNPRVRRILREHDGRAALDPDHLWDEIDERLAPYYHCLWSKCSPDEQQVLRNLAWDGFVSWKARKTVRRLLERGLIRRAPQFQLMNEAFRRYVTSEACAQGREEIRQAADSPWDLIRWPFTAALIGGIVLFFATQQELFNSTLTIITSLTGALPVVLKLFSMLTGKNAASVEQEG